MRCILLSVLALIPFFVQPVDVRAQAKVKAAYASISPNFAGLWVAKEAGVETNHRGDGAGKHALSTDPVLFFYKDDEAEGSTVAQTVGSFCATPPRLLVLPIGQLPSDEGEEKNPRA